MGQYFKFVNVTKEEESQVGLPFNFGLPWAKNLDQASEQELKECFEFVVRNNHWPETDSVVAYGDYGSTVNDPRELAVRAVDSSLPKFPGIQLMDGLSCVKLEMGVGTLEFILQALLEKGRHDRLQRFIIQLWTQEYITKEEVSRLAGYYGVGPLTVP